MIRILFTGQDFARLRIATEPDPMWESLLSLHLLQQRTGALPFRQWRDTVRGRLSGAIRPLVALAPANGYSPDFLTPAGAADGLESGIDALRSTPADRLAVDLRLVARYRPSTAWTRALPNRDGEALGHLADLVRGYHRVAIAPYWSRIRAAIAAERSAQTRLMAEQGVERMVSLLHPNIRWRSGALEVHGIKTSRDIHLNGRGLRLIPSYFCWQEPTLLRDPGMPPVLVYPIEHRFGRLATPTTGPDRQAGRPLVALLGRTRAAVLEAVSSGCTTSELAERVGVSPATASQHASVLRDAGLISTRRLGGSVLHSLRPLGTDVLTEGTLDPR